MLEHGTFSSDAGPNLLVEARITDGDVLAGYLYNPADPGQHFVLELLVNGYVRAMERAALSGLAGPDNPAAQNHCFRFQLPPALRLMRDPPLLELRLANTSRIVAALRYTRIVSSSDAFGKIGEARWDGGLRILGKLAAHTPGRIADAHIKIYESTEQLEIFVEKNFLIDHDYRWGFFSFVASLPLHLADGRPHRLRILDDLDRELEGSPLVMVAHTKGVAGILETLADPQDGPPLLRSWGSYLQQMLPASLPLREFDAWRDCYCIAPPSQDDRCVLVVSVGEGDQPSVILGEPGPTKVIGASSADGISLDSKFWSELASAVATEAPAAVLFTRHGARLRPGWRDAVLEALSHREDIQIVYSDVEIANSKRVIPLFLPAFDKTRWFTQAYPFHFFALSPNVVESLLRLRPSNIPLLVIETLGALRGKAQDAIVHVPRILACVPPAPLSAASEALSSAMNDAFGALGMRAKPQPAAEVLPGVVITRPPLDVAVDILIPTRDRLDLLKPCMETLLSRTKGLDWRVTIIDNDSREAATFNFLEDMAKDERVQVMLAPGIFNYARINNEAVEATKAPLICFLNNDIEIVDPDWLEVMRSHFWDQEVGGVGARLLWPNGIVQHGGVILGSYFAASHAYDHLFATDAGLADGLLVEREGSAMTAACLMVRRKDFLSVGGFDAAAFPVAFNDVDLCLKLRALGRRLIWTPQATLIHKESQSRGMEDNPEKERRARREIENLRVRWGGTIGEDPYYHPCLNLNSHAFSALALPPRSLKPRLNEAPTRDD